MLGSGLAVALLFQLRASRRTAMLQPAALAVKELADGHGRAVALPDPRGLPKPEADIVSGIDRLDLRMRGAAATGRYLDNLLNCMPDGLLVTDAEGRILRSNPAAVALCGRSATVLRAMPIHDLMAPSERRTFTLSRAGTERRDYLLDIPGGAVLPVALSGSQLPGHVGYLFLIQDITDRRLAQRRIRFLATHDSLTRMPNRSQFQHLLQQAISRARRQKQLVALLYIDLDRFKDVNDSFGHASGDRVLEVLSERLARLLPAGAVAGRLAGDEFAVFVEGLPKHSGEMLAGLAQQILDRLGAGFQLNDHEVYLSVSIGIALSEAPADNPIELIRHADVAMYHAKQSGGATWTIYESGMSRSTVERLVLKSRLRRAIELDELEILYQPKVDLMSGRIAGAEALLRWHLADEGDIAPSRFIPLAEQTGLIHAIGDWVFRRVCRDYAAWRAAGLSPRRISINLSAQELRQASLLARLAAVLREQAIEHSDIELEITESTIMDDERGSLKVLEELAATGVRLAIDDFGTGYSSLSALQRMPVQTLKVDQSFVRNMTTCGDDLTLVQAIIEMGRNLHMQVIAEGVEEHAQLASLQASGCHQAQGKLFADPMNADAFAALLAADARGKILVPDHFFGQRAPA